MDINDKNKDLDVYGFIGWQILEVQHKKQKRADAITKIMGMIDDEYVKKSDNSVDALMTDMLETIDLQQKEIKKLKNQK